MISLPGISPNIVDAMNAHWDAAVIHHFAKETAGADRELLDKCVSQERFAFRQFVCSQCHSEQDISHKLGYLYAGAPGGRDVFISALLDEERGDDLPAAFLRSLIISGPARPVPVLPANDGPPTPPALQ